MMKYRVLFQSCPIWQAGERDVDAEARRVRQQDLAADERYPGDYRGRAISVIPIEKRFSQADVSDPSRMAVVMELADEERDGLRTGLLKVSHSLGLEDVDFDDRWGAVAETLRLNFVDPEAIDPIGRNDDIESRRFDEVAIIARMSLPKTEVHTGAGLYEVGPGKTYSTIQSALDQLWTDQGSATFTAPQFIRIFADTYDENPSPNSGLNSIEGFALVIEGDPATALGSIIIQPSGGSSLFLLSNDDTIVVRHLTLDGSNVSNFVLQVGSAVAKFTAEDCAITGGGSWAIFLQGGSSDIVDCTISNSSSSGAILAQTLCSSYIARCLVLNVGSKGSRQGIVLQGGIVEACVIANFSEALREQIVYTPLEVRNNTFYDCTEALRIDPSPATVIFINNIVSVVTDVIRITSVRGWPDEATKNVVGNSYVMRNNIFHSYSNFANDGTTQHTYAEFTAFDRVDAAGNLDATDPQMTDPGNGDFSLGGASPALNAGHGSSSVRDYLQQAYDANEPDIGAWSSGVLPPVSVPDAPSITAVVNDGNGTSATFSVTTDSGSKVFILSRIRNSSEAWTVKGSRTDSGDIVASTYTNNRNYESIAIATFGELVSQNPSLPSIPVSVLVTDSAGFYAAIQQALYDWVDGELGIPVIWAPTNAPQPAKEYAAIDMRPTQGPQFDYKSPPDAVNGISTLRGDREFIVQVQIQGKRLPNNENAGLTLAEQLATSLQKESIIAAFDAAGFAFVDRVATTDLSALGGTEFESRASLELMFRMGHETTDTVGVIETVEAVEGTYQ